VTVGPPDSIDGVCDEFGAPAASAREVAEMAARHCPRAAFGPIPAAQLGIRVELRLRVLLSQTPGLRVMRLAGPRPEGRLSIFVDICC
jgi:hypothetical protein